ncbi:MAG: phosphodiester glycosidase family protein [Planctomycetota bacterium]|nr:phosphodiester glycosidase family protein [Planctomycetota bacterium]
MLIAGAGIREAHGQVVQSEPFLGVKLYSITQTIPRPLNIRLVEIDLNQAELRFRMSPRDPGLPNGDETITQTTRQYVDEQTAQIGINTSFFRLENGLEARPTNNNGIAVSDGDRYSPWDSTGQVGLNLTEANLASIITAPSNRPTGYETNPAGTSLFNAVAGSNRLLNGGSNVAPADSTAPGDFLNLNPRTAAGVAPGNKLLLATIDGRRAGFSEGMYLREVADLLKSYGATDAINLDGGGSTTMAFDYYGDGATRAQLVNRPSGSERYNGASLGIFAARNPGYVPPTAIVTVPSVVGSIRILDDFEDSNGHFRNDPDFSGSNRGLRETTDGVGPSAAARDANEFLHGFAAHRIDLVSQDDPTWNGFLARHLSGGGSPGQNEVLGTSGFVGFWTMTTTDGLLASIGLDEAGSSTIESGVTRSIIADGQWHLYEWNLADAAQWDGFNNGNGQIDGPYTTVDSIMVSSLIDQDARVWVDALSYNPNGSLATLVPEPGGIGFLGLAALLMSRRRKRGRVMVSSRARLDRFL